MRHCAGGQRSAAPWAGALLVTALTLLATSPAAGRWRESEARWGRSAEDFQWRGRIATGRAIEVKGVNGDIHAEATSGNEVEIVARRSARRSDPDEVRIEVVEHEDGVTVCAVYPTPRGSLPNRCEPGEGGRMNTRDNDVQVEFSVRVPAGVRLVARTVNGGIEARGLTADAEAHTVNGSVEIATRGLARARTVNGSIEAEMGTVRSEPLEFQTVNGGITLVVPAGCNADLEASTVNGDIQSDLPITVRGKISRRKLTGTLGRGGAPLLMTTVNGNIRLRTSS